MKQMLLRLPEDLLDAINREASHNLVTRSVMIRRMLVAYLRPETLPRQPVEAEGSEELYVDPDELIKALQRQKQLVAVRAILRERAAEKARARATKKSR